MLHNLKYNLRCVSVLFMLCSASQSAILLLNICEQCGAVSLVKTVRNPISLARIVMDKTTHNYIVGDAAEKLAVQESLAREDPAYFSTEKRREQLMKAKQAGRIVNDHDLEDKRTLDPLSFQNHPSDNSTEEILGSMQTERISMSDSVPVLVDSVAVDVDSFNTEITPTSPRNTDLEIVGKYLEGDFPGSTGTVGCVCMMGGHVAAATSTGGLTNKMAGRIGEAVRGQDGRENR
jgi:isoaspartyl peptidase/L-asparaginase-like protein (Ntn-hydrolase superfamily)